MRLSALHLCHRPWSYACKSVSSHSLHMIWVTVCIVYSKRGCHDGARATDHRCTPSSVAGNRSLHYSASACYPPIASSRSTVNCFRGTDATTTSDANRPDCGALPVRNFPSRSKMKLLASVAAAAALAVSTTQAQYASIGVSYDFSPKFSGCQQVACWVSTSNRGCAKAAADKVQRELMKGRDSYGIEKVGPNGMWVRYWRTKYEPPDRGNIAWGKCQNRAAFTVSNCQSTGDVKC